MAIQHIKSNTIADMTGTVTVYNSAGVTATVAATNLIRPADWNSAHKINYVLGGNTAGSSNVSGNEVEIHGGNNITLSADTANSRLIISAAAGGGGVTVNNAELFPLGANSAFITLGQNTIYFQRFVAQSNVVFSNMEIRVSGSTVSSTNNHTVSHTYDYGLYSRQTGASSTRYSKIAASQIIIGASVSSNVSAGFTVSQWAVNYTNTSAGTANMSLLSGFKHMYMPFTNDISAGGEYAIAMRMSSATTGGTNALRLGVKFLTQYNNLTIGKIMIDTVIATNASHVGDFAGAGYSATSSNLPDTLAISGLTNIASQARLYVQFEA